jgi:hypothetical protein
MSRWRIHPAFLAIMLTLLGAPGCRLRLGNILTPGVPGSGTIVEEMRQVGPFNAIEVHGALQARVEIADESALKLIGDDNLLPMIVTQVRDGRLVVEVKAPQGIEPTRPIEIIATTPTLTGATAHGASTIEAALSPAASATLAAYGASRVAARVPEAAALSIEAAGASRVEVAGQAREVAISASGASQVKAEGLAAETARVEASGASSAKLQAARSVEGEASGASNIAVRGNPATRRVGTSGASSVSYEAVGRARE